MTDPDDRTSGDRPPADDLATWDAAYLLDALSAEERREYERYLAAHPERAAELADLAALPGILDALSPEEALALTDLAPSGQAPAAGPAAGRGADGDSATLVSLAQAAARRRRRARFAGLAGAIAAAAALAVIGGVVGATVFGGRGAQVQTVAMAPMQPGERDGVTARLAVIEQGWGTELNWSCSYTKDWARNVDSYDLVVITRDGAETTVGSWRPAGDEATGLSAATAIPTRDIRAIEIRVSGSDQPLAVTTL
ncbi:hypothetical protein [Mycolicibacterium hassiacum]|nr:hypothetical protein [Mycolicibacterium hassiacum]MBX5487009.1 hypothetical protein [Mycolicibacterium hassiacum]